MVEWKVAFDLSEVREMSGRRTGVGKKSFVIGSYKFRYRETTPLERITAVGSGHNYSRSQKIVLFNMICGFIIFGLLGSCLASYSANQYIDGVLQTALPFELHASALDPAHLPSFEVPFGHQDIYSQMAQASFFGGNATGFDKVRRGGDCLGPRFSRGELSINCTLRLFPLITNYGVRVVEDNNRVHNIRNMGHVEETLVYVGIVGQQSRNFVGSIVQFQVQKMGLITPTFAGLPQQYFKYVKVLQDAYKANVSSYLFNVLQQGFKTALSRAVASKPLPRQ